MRYSTQMLIISIIPLGLAFLFVIVESTWLGFFVGILPGWLLARAYLSEYLEAITNLGWVRPESDLTEEEHILGALAVEEGRQRGARGGAIGGILAGVLSLLLGQDFYYELATMFGIFTTTILVYYALNARKLERKYW